MTTAPRSCSRERCRACWIDMRSICKLKALLLTLQHPVKSVKATADLAVQHQDAAQL